jgi:DNA invertase Pin-like site-specific DNA recombinase
VFSEQVSSVASRTKLAGCLGFLRQGDALTVTKPDRLARSTAELLTIEADLSKRGIGLVVLSMGGERLDTRNPTSKLMLTILAGVATWEREIMLERQREGIAKAKAEGKYKGRKPTVGLQVDTIRKMRADGLGPATIARQLGVARSSVYRMLEAPA